MKYLPLLALLFLACQNKLQPGQIARELGPARQQFQLTIGVDTIVRCKDGTVLHFCPNTFVASDKKIELEVVEVLNRGDALLSGISTLAVNGRLLETAGMVYLNASTKNGSAVSINPDCPVKVELPAKGREAGMKWFKGDAGSAGVLWTEQPDGFVDQAGMNNLETGQQLFEKNCANCHCRDMNGYLTGPPLGNITQYRDKEWLRQFTRNSQQLIASGDSLATCLWIRWKPSIMPSFKALTDPEIDAIYQFIEQEGARLNVNLPAAYYTCTILNDSVGHMAAPPGQSAAPPPVYSPKPNPYFAKVYGMGWYNCDRFYKDSTAKAAQIMVSIPDAESYDEVLAGIIFDEIDANIQLNNYGNGQFETSREWEVLLPRAPAHLVVFAIKGKKWFQYEQAFQVDWRNAFKAELKPTTAEKVKEYVAQKSFKRAEEPVLRSCPASEG